MKRLLYILLIILFFSTCQQGEKKDLTGEWIIIPCSDNLDFLSIKFSNDKVLLIDEFERVQIGKYHLKKNELLIDLNKYKLKTKVKYFNKDSIELFDNVYYSGLNMSNFELDSYNLISVESDYKLSYDNYSFFFHFYRFKNQLKIRFNDKYIDFNDIPRALYGGHNKMSPFVHFFIGENINLSDLNRLYYELKSWGIDRINLIVDKPNSKDYRLILDKIEIFDDDLSNFIISKERPPLEISSRLTRKEFLKNNIKHIHIKENKDIDLIKDLNNNHNYLISIKEKIDLKIYMEILKITNKIKRERKAKIRVEIV